jgi:ligand-binding sensor domain-containing protein
MKYWLSGILLLNSVIVYAQEFRFKTYTTKDGLSGNTVTASIKDKQGFLWLATGNGLNRFDGNAFDGFYHNPKDSLSLAANQVQSLCTDRQQRLWVGSVGGISLYHPKQQNFTNYYPDSGAGKCGRWFNCMLPDETGNIWVGTWYELLIFDLATQKFQRSGWADFAAAHKPVNGNNSRVVVISLLKKATDEFWILTTYGLYSVNTKTKKFQWHPYTGIEDYFGCQLTHADEAGNLWMGTYSKGIVFYDVRTRVFSNYLPPAGWNSVPGFNRIYGITRYNGDTLMYAGLDGLGLFDARNKRYISRIADSKPGIYNIQREEQGFWLFGNDGLTHMKPAQNPVKKFTPFGNGTYINKIYPLHHLPGMLVMENTTARQTGILNSETNTFLPFKQANGQPVGSELSGWLQLNNQTAYLSTEELLYRVNPETREAVLIPLPPKQITANNNVIRNIVEDDEGQIWIRFRGQGIIRHNPANGQTAYINILPPSQNRAYSALHFNKKQRCIWLAAEHEGLYQYHIQKKTTMHYPLTGKQFGPAADISCIASDASDNMYMTDVVRGLYFYETNTGKFSLYTRQNGLPADNCYFVTLDTAGWPWVITAAGVARLNTTTGIAQRLDDNDMLPKEIGFITANANGTVYTCFNQHYYSWNVSQLSVQNKLAKTYLRSIRINNQPAFIDSVYQLPFSKNNISLQIGAILPASEGLVDFEYALNNTQTWLPVENSHTLNFSNLAPGKYRIYFRLKGSNQFSMLRFNIIPPWYKRAWFWAPALVFSGVAVFLLMRRRISGIRKQALLKQKVAETEMMALRAQMNPHFIFNCISSIDNFIQDNDKENASAWLSKFAKLIRGVLDNSRQDVIPFWKDWETLRLYTELEQLRTDDAFRCHMQADEALLNGHYRIPPLIIQPYVENAIHHGLKNRFDKNGVLTISAKLEKQQLVFTIEDNGIGRKKAAELKTFNNISHSSYGMQLSSERIHLFNAQPGNVSITDLHDALGNACGTRVQITLSV